MAAMFDNKVRVTKMFGASASVGWIDAQVDMQVKTGPGLTYHIVNIYESGSHQIGLATSGDGMEVRRAFPSELYCEYSHATGTWSYPTGDGSVEWSRYNDSGVYANGIPQASAETGHYYAQDDGTVFSFGR